MYSGSLHSNATSVATILFGTKSKFTEICPDVQAQFTFFKRTQVKQLGVLSRSELKERMKTGKQVLCILNSREDSQSLYRELWMN